MKTTLTVKQKSILVYFVDSAQDAGPDKINQLCRLALSSKLNVGTEFPSIIESFMDCNSAQIKERCENIRKRIL